MNRSPLNSAGVRAILTPPRVVKDDAMFTRRFACVMVAILIMSLGCGAGPGDGDGRDPVTLDVEIHTGWGGGTVHVVFNDSQTIEKIFDTPVKNAVENKSPANYQILGKIEAKYKDKSQRSMVIFLPWGQYADGKKYMTADFDLLKKALNEPLQTAERLTQ